MIEEFTISHLDRVVDLHYKILSWSINSRLGKKHIYNLYKTILNSNNCFGYVFIQNDELIGVITGTTDWKVSQKELYTNYSIKDYLSLLFICLKKPVDFIDIFENIFLLPKALAKINLPTQALTFITDTTASAAPFVAVKLFIQFKKHLKEKAINSFFSQVAKYDKKPNNFYRDIKSSLVKSYIRNNIYIVKS